MSDGLKLDWLDGAKWVATTVITAAVGVLVRLLIGGVLKSINEKLAGLEASNGEQTKKLDELGGHVTNVRIELASVKSDVEGLKRPPFPAPTPRARP